MKSKDTSVVLTMDWVLRSLGFIVFSLSTFFLHQLNENIAKLTDQIHIIEIHQIDTDKRVAAIEVSREINMTGYQKLVSDVQDMKQNLIQLTMRTQTISDFIANSFSKKK